MRRLLRDRLLCEFVVTLKSGAAFRGLLHSSDGEVLVLRNAEAIGADGSRTVVDGEAIVFRSEVEFLQRP